MRGHHVAVSESYVGQEALVPVDKGPLDEPRPAQPARFFVGSSSNAGFGNEERWHAYRAFSVDAEFNFAMASRAAFCAASLLFLPVPSPATSVPKYTATEKVFRCSAPH